MKIGRYEVCGLLGRGGMGVVYKVRQPVTGRVAALKLLKPADILVDLAGMDALREGFLHEATVMASLDHPHVAAVWDVDEAGGLPFFVMEYYCLNLGLLMGESYRVEAPRRRLPLERAVRYARQTLEALRRMHHEGIVHRDVKPFNIMVTGDDAVKLIDFGLSRLRGETRLSPRGVKVGSPYYAPPEQESAPDAVDARADLYPVGVMLFRMLTGILPTDEERMKDGRIPRASALSDELDEGWDAFFDTAMAADPVRRFPDAASMLAALARCEAAWRKQVEATCRLMPEQAAGPGDASDMRHDAGREPVQPGQTGETGQTDETGQAGQAVTCEGAPAASGGVRCRPVKVGVHEARATFALDALWRPACAAMPGLQARDDGTVSHAATGLQWETGGCDFPLTRDEAEAYVEARNALRFAGHDDWRLPTVDELLTLVDAGVTVGDPCVASVFAPLPDPLWTSDRKSYMASWFVSAAMGFVGWQDDTCRFGVRLVRGGSAGCRK